MGSIAQPIIETDVLICGAGPVGLLLAYSLKRYGISTHVVEQHDPSKKVNYGRAVMLMPRTLEILDQLDLVDAFGQIGFFHRGQQAFKNGERQDLSGVIPPLMDTYYPCVLTIRQRWTEKIIADAYLSGNGAGLQYGKKLLSFESLPPT